MRRKRAIKTLINQLTAAYVLFCLILVMGSVNTGVRYMAGMGLAIWLLSLARPKPYNRLKRLKRNGGTHTPADWQRIKVRAHGRCSCCGARAELTKDHIIPIALGGTDDSWNIQALCAKCNRAKGTRIIDYR